MDRPGAVRLAMAVSSSVSVTSVRSQEVMANANTRIARMIFKKAMVFLLGDDWLPSLVSGICNHNAKWLTTENVDFCALDHGKPHQKRLCVSWGRRSRQDYDSLNVGLDEFVSAPALSCRVTSDQSTSKRVLV